MYLSTISTRHLPKLEVEKRNGGDNYSLVVIGFSVALNLIFEDMIIPSKTIRLYSLIATIYCT
jgi:hypothetical protein